MQIITVIITVCFNSCNSDGNVSCSTTGQKKDRHYYVRYSNKSLMLGKNLMLGIWTYSQQYFYIQTSISCFIKLSMSVSRAACSEVTSSSQSDMNITVFCDLTPCIPVQICLHMGGAGFSKRSIIFLLSYMASCTGRSRDRFPVVSLGIFPWYPRQNYVP